MALDQINDNFDLVAAKPLDNRAGPYASVAAANAAIDTNYRYQGLTVQILVSGSAVDYWYKDGTQNADLVEKTSGLGVVAPTPEALVDGAAISFNLNSKFLDIKTLTTTTTAITLTLSNVVQGANQILSVVKNTASDVTITLAGSGLTFYGYDNFDYNTTPDVILSGASGDIFDISFLARTATEIGVAIGQNGN
jgi:hypothetical protein